MSLIDYCTDCGGSRDSVECLNCMHYQENQEKLNRDIDLTQSTESKSNAVQLKFYFGDEDPTKIK